MTFNHAAITVSSENTVSFYEKLGFKIRSRIERPNDVIYFMDGCGTTVELFLVTDYQKRPDNPEPLGLKHLAFNVINFDEILTQFDCGEIKSSSSGGRRTFIFDPEGTSIEFIESLQK